MAGAERLLRVICCVTLLLAVRGAVELNATTQYQYFTSPNYPANYPHNTIVTWHIRTDISNKVIELDVVDSYVEFSYTCNYDYVQVYDGEDTNAKLLKDFCGTTEPTLKSSGRNMYVKFRSDNSVSYRGFKIRYSAVDPDVNVNVSLIVGCVFAAIAGIAIIGCIVFCICQAKSSSKQRVQPNRSNAVAMTSMSAYPASHTVAYYGQNYGWVQPQPGAPNPPPYAAQPPAYSTLGFGPTPQGGSNTGGSNATAPAPNSSRSQDPPPYPGVTNPSPSRGAPPPPSTAPPAGSGPRPITAGFGMMPPSSTQDPAYPPPPASYQEP